MHSFALDYFLFGAVLHLKQELVTTMFILIVWIIAVTAFAGMIHFFFVSGFIQTTHKHFSGPVMTLVVQPIERMVLLLSMLMKDPLGYQK